MVMKNRAKQKHSVIKTGHVNRATSPTIIPSNIQGAATASKLRIVESSKLLLSHLFISLIPFFNY
jgi:hypothetical protein